MKRNRSAIMTLVFIIITGVPGLSQTAWYYRTGLLPESTLDLLINESSGEQPLNTIIDLSNPWRKRTNEEYADLLFETRYIVAKLKEYGLTGITTEKLGKTQVWRPVKGELTEVSPGKSVIAGIDDISFSLHPVSAVAETDGELVDIGDANSSKLDRMDLSGKIVLTSARPERLMNIFLQKDVAGVISYFNYPLNTNEMLIPDRKIENIEREFKSKIFVFKVTPRDGYILRDRLKNGEKIILHGSVRYRTEEMENQVTSCIIPGTDPNAGEIIFSAHLFEGYGVQGANDNMSGSAAILETARVLNKLITEGKLTKPRRTFRFIWVAEYSGTIPWVKAHGELIKKTLCNINLDMVGLSLSRFQSYFVLHRTSYGDAHYLNDVMENYYRYVAENNQKNSVVSGDRFFKPIIAPTGSSDPFRYHYLIESSSGGSDHDIFNDFGVGVPGILMITWPDPFYHTSEDRADKIDPTQLRRVAFICSAAAYTIAQAGENEAVAIAGEVYGNSVRRLGYQISMENDRINKAFADTLVELTRVSMSRLRGVALGEAMTLNSVTELSPSNQFLKDLVARQAKSLADMAAAASLELLKTAGHVASDFGMEPLVITQTREEREKSAMVPVLTESRKGMGLGIIDERLSKISDAAKERYKVSGFIEREEAAKCINGKNSLLDIKYILDSQRDEETKLKDLENFFRQMESAGMIKM